MKKILIAPILYILGAIIITTIALLTCPACSTQPDANKERFIIEEGEILSIDDLENGSIVYVLYENNGQTYSVEVDVFQELIYTTIEVGDTAIYCRDEDWTDANLLAVIKKEHAVSQKTQKIIEYALADIGETGYATLYFIHIEEAWEDYEEASYIMTLNGKLYVVSVMERGDDIHSVDVTDELEAIRNVEKEKI